MKRFLDGLRQEDIRALRSRREKALERRSVDKSWSDERDKVDARWLAECQAVDARWMADHEAAAQALFTEDQANLGKDLLFICAADTGS